MCHSDFDLCWQITYVQHAVRTRWQQKSQFTFSRNIALHMHVDDLKIFVRDGSATTKKKSHTKSRILNYSIKVKIDATLIFKRQPTLQKLLKKQSRCLNKSHSLWHSSFVVFFFHIIIIIIILFWVGIYHFQVETEIHRLAYGIVIQITLRSNHHYAKLNDINRVCQQKCWSCFFTKIHLSLIHWNVCVCVCARAQA